MSDSLLVLMFSNKKKTVIIVKICVVSMNCRFEIVPHLTIGR